MRAALLACLLAGAAWADEIAPWARDVPMARQDAANTLFAEGNELFAVKQHAPAAEKYRAAIALWDHPMIRYNLAITLIRIGQPLEAAEHLDQALRYGERPFPSRAKYDEGLDYQRLIAGQLGFVAASCTQPGVEILLDGASWFACPGSRTQRVMSGEHTLVAEHPRYVTRVARDFVAGGATMTHAFTLQSFDEAVRYEYPMRRWVPWTVTGAGAALLAVGASVWVVGRSGEDDARARSILVCGDGCTDRERAAAGLDDDFATATLQRRIGIGIIVGGVIATATGAYLAITNRPTRIPAVDVSARGVAVTWHY